MNIASSLRILLSHSRWKCATNGCCRLKAMPVVGFSDDAKQGKDGSPSSVEVVPEKNKNSSGSDESEGERPPSSSPSDFKGDSDKVAQAKNKLASLLSSMSAERASLRSVTISTKLAKPVRPPKVEPKIEQLDINDVSVGLNERLVKAVKTVARSIGGQDWEQTKSDLFRVLEAHEQETTAAKDGHPIAVDLSKVISGMKIDKKKSEGRRQQVRSFEFQKPMDDEQLPSSSKRSGQRRLPPLRPREPSSAARSIDYINIYRGESLAIFDVVGEQEGKLAEEAEEQFEQVRLETWDSLRREELKMLTTQPASNAFEEMIRWTEQGKLWKYPIDNEQGLDREAQVPFYEHVFLEHWLESFPGKEGGPIRHFMEIMLLGLSRNPYLTVERKKAYVDWFKTYFEEKQDILRQTGAL